MGSSSQTPATTTQSKDPWSGAQPYLTNEFATAQNLFNTNTGYQPYTGSTLAPLHPWQTQGLGDLYGTALGQMSDPSLGNALNLSNQVMSSGGLSPYTTTALGQLQNLGGQYQNVVGAANTPANPYLQDIINTNNRQITDKVASQMSGAGRYGSGQYTDVLTRALAESANPILAQDYEARQARMMQALQGQGQTQQTISGVAQGGLNTAGNYAQLIPQIMQAQLQPAQTVADVGQFYTGYGQQALADSIKAYNAQQAYPWEQLSRFNAILSGAGGLGGTTVTASSPYSPSLTQRLLGGALAGGALGAGVGGGVGAGIGALGGGLFGAFA